MKSHKLARSQTAKRTNRPYSRPEPAPLPNSELMDQIQIIACLKISARMWIEGVQKGYFPQPIRLGPRMLRWRRRDIVQIIDQGTNGTEKWKSSDAQENAGAAS